MAETITRPTFWEGQFYPETPEKLEKMMADFLDRVPVSDIQGEIFGLVVPHAGYIYSGQTAAAAYKTLSGKKYQTVIVIGPSHALNFPGVSIFNGDYYETVLGTISVDKKMAGELARQNAILRLSGDGHLPAGFDGRAEHSLEVQLPFLLEVLEKNFQIVPVVFHDYRPSVCQALAEAIASVSQAGETLVVASSDLYHGQNYEECLRTDRLTVEKICSMDWQGFNEGILDGRYQACGGGPIVSLLGAAAAHPGARARVVAQTNSADVASVRRGYVVGYASIIVTVDGV